VLNLSRTAKLQIKLLQKSSQPCPLLNNLIDDNDDNDGLDNLDLQCGYSRPKVYKVEKTVTYFDDTFSDYVTVRLAIARAKAIQKYREIYIAA